MAQPRECSQNTTGSSVFCAEPMRIMVAETATSRVCAMPRVRTAPRSESVGLFLPNSAEFALRRHCAASDLSRPMRSATRSRFTFSGSCPSSASRLCKMAGTLGIESNRSSRPESNFCKAELDAAGSLKHWSGTWCSLMRTERVERNAVSLSAKKDACAANPRRSYLRSHRIGKGGGGDFKKGRGKPDSINLIQRSPVRQGLTRRTTSSAASLSIAFHSGSLFVADPSQPRKCRLDSSVSNFACLRESADLTPRAWQVQRGAHGAALAK
jgi:hypothetical protein